MNFVARSSKAFVSGPGSFSRDSIVLNANDLRLLENDRISFSIILPRSQGSGLRKKDHPLRNQVGIHEIFPVRIVRKEFSGKHRLTDSVRPCDDVKFDELSILAEWRWFVGLLSLPPTGRQTEPRLLHLREDNLFAQALPVHPALRMDPYEPILDSWDTPEVFPHVLFAEVAGLGISAPSKLRTLTPKRFSAKKIPWGVMPKRTVAEVGEKRLRFVKPAVNR